MNTVRTADGTEVYVSRIYELADEYIAGLKDPEDIEKKNVFTGLIKYIHHNICFGSEIYEDVFILYSVWDTYTDIVYKYNQRPTLEEFAILTGIHRDTFYSWMNGETRSEDRLTPSITRSDTVKKMQAECQLARYKGAESGNVGCIFLCKAVDHMVETAPAAPEPLQQRPTRTAAEIAAGRDLSMLPEPVKPEI